MEMKMIQQNVAEAMNEVVEKASAVQMEKLTDLTMKVENALSAFDARIEILSCLKEVTQDLLLRKTISTLFLKIKTSGEDVRNVQGMGRKEATVNCIDVDVEVDASDTDLEAGTKAKW